MLEYDKLYKINLSFNYKVKDPIYRAINNSEKERLYDCNNHTSTIKKDNLTQLGKYHRDYSLLYFYISKLLKSLFLIHDTQY